MRIARHGVPTRMRRLFARTPKATGAAPEDPFLTVSADDERIVRAALPFTMTSAARLIALVDAVRYCVARDVPGAFAECGVWRGGSVLAMLLTLQSLGRTDRDVYLYDTFEGMTEPTEHDVSALDPPALETWRAAQERNGRPWAEVFGPDAFDEDAVRRTVLSSGYPPERVHLVRGAVEQTIPAHAPGDLALLRLDTDWYESTRHELEHLYPALARGGVLIIDDYGHWDGARRAVDEYFSTLAPPLLLNRIDYTGRVAVKQ
jgi:hypothetical protein